ncbi:MAG: 50S ribosomal protein L25 [Bacteroidetes bacterium]|nr:MAG: 50S ribosomal protein L25 [Bacteroidota bacterium]
MSEITLKAVKRGTGKKGSKLVRSSGMIPGIYYSEGSESIPLAAHPLALRPIVYTAHKKIFDLYIDDSTQPLECVLKDIAFHPVTDKLLHFDLFGVKSGKMMGVEVPIILKGQAIGVRDGGVLQHTTHKVKLHCLPSDMPDSFEIDISNLSIGKSVHVKDIQREGIHFDVALDTVIVSCLHPRLIKEETPAEKVEEGAAAAEEGGEKKEEKKEGKKESKKED